VVIAFACCYHGKLACRVLFHFGCCAGVVAGGAGGGAMILIISSRVTGFSFLTGSSTLSPEFLATMRSISAKCSLCSGEPRYRLYSSRPVSTMAGHAYVIHLSALRRSGVHVPG
jgi:hypothetical protein